jgi:hypothetical protein
VKVGVCNGRKRLGVEGVAMAGSYQNNREFLAAYRGLLDCWCARRCFKALLYALPGFFAFNGMTDGWGEVRYALRRVRGLVSEELTAGEIDTIGDLLACVDSLLERGNRHHGSSASTAGANLPVSLELSGDRISEPDGDSRDREN